MRWQAIANQATLGNILAAGGFIEQDKILFLVLGIAMFQEFQPANIAAIRVNFGNQRICYNLDPRALLQQRVFSGFDNRADYVARRQGT